MILKIEKKINNLNHALDSLKETHTYIVDEHYNISDTLVEKVAKVEYVTCPSLKLKIETLKGQLTHITLLSCTWYRSSSDRGEIFKKNYHGTLGEIEKAFLSKVICYSLRSFISVTF